MKSYAFVREPACGLIRIRAVVDDKYELLLALDTGATHTTLDSNALYLAGHALKDSLGPVSIETAGGIIETDVFSLTSLEALGLTRAPFPVQVYDFLAHGIFSDYNGVLGLDFLEAVHFCVDLTANTITIHA